MIGVGQRGRIALDFTRTARSALAAISSALRDVRKAMPQATLVEASPDFVGLTDVADFAGFTRQNMRKLMLGNNPTFPAALHDGNPSLWHLADILSWLDIGKAARRRRPARSRPAAMRSILPRKHASCRVRRCRESGAAVRLAPAGRVPYDRGRNLRDDDMDSPSGDSRSYGGAQ